MTFQVVPTDLLARPNEELLEHSSGLQLEVLSGGACGRTFRLDKACGGMPFIGGRDPSGDVVLPDARVSARHFELALVGARVLLRDIGSTNGIRIGGAEVAEAALSPGCVFEVADTRLRLTSIATEAVPASTHISCGTMAGASEPMRALFATLERYAPSPFSALVTGETGTGKGEVARTLHRLSPLGAHRAIRSPRLRDRSPGACCVPAPRPRQGRVHRSTRSNVSPLRATGSKGHRGSCSGQEWQEAEGIPRKSVRPGRSDGTRAA